MCGVQEIHEKLAWSGENPYTFQLKLYLASQKQDWSSKSANWFGLMKGKLIEPLNIFLLLIAAVSLHLVKCTSMLDVNYTTEGITALNQRRVTGNFTI